MAGVGLLVFTDSPGAAISLIPVLLVVIEEEEGRGRGRGRRGGPKSSVWGWEVSSTITSFPMESTALRVGLVVVALSMDKQNFNQCRIVAYHANRAGLNPEGEWVKKASEPAPALHLADPLPQLHCQEDRYP